MSLQRIHDAGVFDDATTDGQRTRVYVRSGELGLTIRADVMLMNALAEQQPPRRIHIVGASGAGKTSLILRVVADLVRRDLEVEHEILILRVGDRPERLDSPEEVISARRQLLSHPERGLRDGSLWAERITCAP